MYRRTIGMIMATFLFATAAYAHTDEGTKWSGFCGSDLAKPQPCAIRDKVGGDGQHDLQFSFGGKTSNFVGKNNSAWWIGGLNGRPAMGYEVSRGHTVYSTTDLKETFECCDKLSSDGYCR